MEMTWNEIGLLLPEIIVATMACVVLVVDLYIREQRRGLVHLLSILTLIFAALATSRGFGTNGQAGVAMAGSFVRDHLGDVLKLFVYLTMAIVFFGAKP